MSSRALEFVEDWVSEKIEARDFSAARGSAQAETLAAQCVQDAQSNGIAKSEIDEAFDDLAAFIAGQIEEAHDRSADRSDEKHPGSLIEDDDARLVDDEEDQAEDEAKDA